MSTMHIHELPLSELKIDPANVRASDKEPDAAFIASIREKDIIVPLTVRQNSSANRNITTRGYLVTDPQPFPQPIPASGAQGFWNWS